MLGHKTRIGLQIYIYIYKHTLLDRSQIFTNLRSNTSIYYSKFKTYNMKIYSIYLLIMSLRHKFIDHISIIEIQPT